MKGNKTYLVLLIVLFIGVAYFQSNKPKPFSWEPSFSRYDKIPFGSYLLYENLGRIAGEHKIKTTNKSIRTTIGTINSEPANYVFINKKAEFTHLETSLLLSFIEDGNNVFIATSEIEGDLADTLNLEMNGEYINDVVMDIGFVDGFFSYSDSLIINFTNPTLKIDSGYLFKNRAPNNYFSKIDSSRTINLGVNNDNRINFIKYEIGQGNLYISSLPRAFSNFFIANPTNHEYAFKALSHLPSTAIIWDEYYKEDKSDNKAISASPLRYVLNQNPLKFAIYLLLTALLVYIIFAAKRKQKVIPTLKPVKNTSLEFVEIVSSLYYNKADHKNIADKKITYFLDFVRRTFGIQTKEIDLNFIRKISTRSGVNQDQVKGLFNFINFIQSREELGEHELMKLSKLIEDFLIKNKR